MYLSNLLTVILLTLAFSANASQKRGGEHLSHDGFPARKAERSQRIELNPRTLPAYINGAQAILENTKRKVPAYGKLMEDVLTEKKWYRTENELNCPYYGSQEIGASPAICQDEFEVTIYWPFFDPNSPDTHISMENQSYALVHEMNRHVAMLKHLSDAAIVNIDDALERDLSESELVSALERYRFGIFASGSEIASTEKYLQNVGQHLYQETCENLADFPKSYFPAISEIIEKMSKSQKKTELIAILDDARISLSKIANILNEGARVTQGNGSQNPNLSLACNALSKKFNPSK